MLQDFAVSLDIVVCGLALGLGVLGLRRHQSLTLTGRGFRWQSQSWQRQGWMNIIAAIALGLGALVITVHSPYVDLVALAASLIWLVLALLNQTAGRVKG